VPDAPDGWEVGEVTRVGPFTTRVVYRPPDGPPVEWTSRAHRKGLGVRELPVGHGELRSGARRRFARLGAARQNRWIGVLFMIGSFLFALGSAPLIGKVLSPDAIGITFFAGSVFFTSAALLQYLQAVGAGGPGDLWRTRLPGRRLFALEPRRIDWWATGIQLLGTVFFNITTFAALNDALDTRQSELRVWAPDALGSVCFLVASYLALAEASHAYLAWRPADRAWQISALNMLGSVFFGISAVTSFIVPSTGSEWNIVATDAFTFLGAVCFFAGAWLLLPESAEAEQAAAATPVPARPRPAGRA
jgi:hypothetical protein